jgi:peptide/nickel transport system ATP-binding protein
MPIFQDPVSSLDGRWPLWRLLTEPVARRCDGASRRAMAGEWLAAASMGDVDLDARPHQISGGQCQRVALLRALMAGPAVLVADEPTARQDVLTAAAVTELIRTAARNGSGVVVVTHDEAWMDTFVDRTLTMRDGRLSA